MRKLPFTICADDGMLEARDTGTKYHYNIFQLGGLCRAVVYPWEPTEELCVGDLYECLDACNKHYNAALMISDLEPIKDTKSFLENGLAMPYVPLLVTDTVDGKKGGYMWEGRIVPVEEADEQFWEEVNRKYPPKMLLDPIEKPQGVS